jgi:hypothetical protein
MYHEENKFAQSVSSHFFADSSPLLLICGIYCPQWRWKTRKFMNTCVYHRKTVPGKENHAPGDDWFSSDWLWLVITGPEEPPGSDDCHWQPERRLATKVKKVLFWPLRKYFSKNQKTARPQFEVSKVWKYTSSESNKKWEVLPSLREVLQKK